MLKFAALAINPGPTENYGLDEDLSTVHVEELFKYKGPETNDILEPYGGSGIGQENEQPIQKDLKKDKNKFVLICVDCEDIDEDMNFENIKNAYVVSINKLFKGSQLFKIDKKNKVDVIKQLNPDILISSDLMSLILSNANVKLYAYQVK